MESLDLIRQALRARSRLVGLWGYLVPDDDLAIAISRPDRR